MPITTTADNRGWTGFDVYDLEASRNSGMTDQQIRDELIAGGFSNTYAAGNPKRIGPDAYTALFNNTQPTPTPTPTPAPSEPEKLPTPGIPERNFSDQPYSQWDFYYGLSPLTTSSTDNFGYTNFAAAPKGQLMNDFATSFMADNSAYTNPMYMPQSQVTTAEEDPSIFEQVMKNTTKTTGNPQTFENIIAYS